MALSNAERQQGWRDRQKAAQLAAAATDQVDPDQGDPGDLDAWLYREIDLVQYALGGLDPTAAAHSCEAGAVNAFER